MPAASIMQQLANFAVETGWAALPLSIVHETRLVLLDTIGCALGALATDKGKMNLALARRYGGPPEASIIGTDDKVSLPTAALVNGELMFALDFTAMIAGGNEPSYVIPAILAMAEAGGLRPGPYSGDGDRAGNLIAAGPGGITAGHRPHRGPAPRAP